MQCAACSRPEAPPVFQWLPGCQAWLHNRCCSDFAVWLKERDALQQLLRAWRVFILWLRRRARIARRDIVLRLTWRWKAEALLGKPSLRFAEVAFTRWWKVVFRWWRIGADTSDDGDMVDTSSDEDMPGLSECNSDEIPMA